MIVLPYIAHLYLTLKNSLKRIKITICSGIFIFIPLKKKQQAVENIKKYTLDMKNYETMSAKMETKIANIKEQYLFSAGHNGMKLEAI